MGGWDLRKTLRLVKKSNPVVWEWLQSPFVYYSADPDTRTKLRQSIDQFFSPISACHHYLSICHRTMDRELAGATVKIKKYFYMLRPILAASWIERFKSIPPMEFEPLLVMIEGQSEIERLVASLLRQKASTDERIPIDRVGKLDSWLEDEYKRIKDAAARLPGTIDATIRPDGPELDRLFRGLVGA